MSNNNSGQTTPKASQGKTESGFLGILRAIALILLIVGAAGSLVFMFRVSQQTPRLLLILFTIWILSPFVALFWAHTVSKRWSAMTRAMLYGVELIVALVSLAIYSGLLNVKPEGSGHAFVFVAIPPISFLFIMIVQITTFLSGKLSRRRSDTQTKH